MTSGREYHSHKRSVKRKENTETIRSGYVVLLVNDVLRLCEVSPVPVSVRLLVPDSPIRVYVCSALTYTEIDYSYETSQSQQPSQDMPSLHLATYKLACSVGGATGWSRWRACDGTCSVCRMFFTSGPRPVPACRQPEPDVTCLWR